MTRRLVPIGICVSLAVALLLSLTLDIDLRLRGNTASAESSSDRFWKEGAPGTPTPSRPDSFADLAERLSPTIVNIQTERTGESHIGSPEDLFEQFFGRQRRRPGRRHRFRSESTGSGFVISEDGFIVTNNHVVENASKIIAVFENGHELVAQIVGLDPKTDLALLKVSSKKKLPAAPLGDSDQVRVGDWVMAIGNPFGLDHTVTVGILSARGRNINAGPYDDFLQTDASINPGNSGGPLIDMTGRVVGINTAINAAGQGIGFAIPINMVKELLPQLKTHGAVTRGWLGVQIQPVTPALAKPFGLDDARGALVSQVFERSPAEKAKLKRGDVIVEFNGSEIRNFDDLPRRVASTPPGTEVDVLVLRNGKRKKLKAVLEEMVQADEIELTSHHRQHSSDWGLSVRTLTASVAKELGLESDATGVVVEQVDPEGPAAQAGVRGGDILLEANRKPLENVQDLEAALEESENHAVLLLQRGDSTLYIAIERD